MSTELVTRGSAPLIGEEEMARLWRVSEGLARSGLFKDSEKATQAFAKVLFGRDLGLSPTEAMTQIHIIEGAPAVSANLQASRIKASEKYDYRVQLLTNESCEIEFSELVGEVWEPVGISTYTTDDAELAGLRRPTRNGKDSNHVKFPRNMLFARAISNGCAWYCPDVMGGLRVYTPEDLMGISPPQLTDGGSPDDAPGLAAGEPEDVVTYLEGLLPDADEDLRGRLALALERVRLAAPGSWPTAKVEMTLSGLPLDKLIEWTQRIEAEAEQVEEGARMAREAFEGGAPEEEAGTPEAEEAEEAEAEAEAEPEADPPGNPS